MSKEAIKKLIESSKATVVAAFLLVFGVLVYLGQVDMAWYQETAKWVVSVWLLAHAGETGLKAFRLEADKVLREAETSTPPAEAEETE